jgi:hypothetical protein
MQTLTRNSLRGDFASFEWRFPQPDFWEPVMGGEPQQRYAVYRELWYLELR